MSQCESLLQMFREGNGRIKRNDILRSGFLAAAYRQRMSDLRAKGYEIDCEEIDGETVFILKAEPPKFEQDGQRVFA